jgi:hypothetical protein
MVLFMLMLVTKKIVEIMLKNRRRVRRRGSEEILVHTNDKVYGFEGRSDNVDPVLNI